MHVTLGGAVAANIHGKNHWRRGSFGEHVAAVTVLDDAGERREVLPGTPEMDGLVGGYGAAGPVVEVALRLKPVETGYFDVLAFALSSLEPTLEALDRDKDDWEYLVAWVDCFPGGRSLGRSVVHYANHAKAEQTGGRKGLDLATQELPSTVFGVVPKSLVSRALGLFTFDLGMQGVDFAKFLAAKVIGKSRDLQPLVAFNFLLDSIPDWRRAYLPGGFIQYQLFVPKESALKVFTRAIELQHEIGAVSYLGVLKRHRKDRFPNAYTPDGFSLALDFPVNAGNAERLIRLCRRLDTLVREAGGSVYRAKDCVGSFERARGAGA
jgi:FAD/FMN-containing dehydrogenase